MSARRPSPAKDRYGRLRFTGVDYLVPAIAAADLGPRVADCEARIRCPECGARAGHICVPGRGSLVSHDARHRRREDLYFVKGCEWCGKAWAETHRHAFVRGPAGDIPDFGVLGFLVPCAAGHLHGACEPCRDAALDREWLIDTRTFQGLHPTPVRCPARAAARAIVLCRRLGQAGRPS